MFKKFVGKLGELGSCACTESSGSWPSEERRIADEETEELDLPCIALPSYQRDDCLFFSLADDRLYDDIRLPVSRRPRLSVSPHGMIFATHCFGTWPSMLVNPFTGATMRLPDLPVPFADAEPMPCRANEPNPRSVVATGDSFAWDWSRYGVMISRRDTLFFWREGEDSWTPTHRSVSPTTVNYRSGFFFVFETHTRFTTIIDAVSLSKVATIRPPPGNGTIAEAYLVASTEDVLLLVRRVGEDEMISQVFRADHRRPKPEWLEARDIGDRALFFDKIHGFSVDTRKLVAVEGNCVYSIASEAVQDQWRRHLSVYDVVEFNLKKRRARLLGCELSRHKIGRMGGEVSWIKLSGLSS